MGNLSVLLRSGVLYGLWVWSGVGPLTAILASLDHFYGINRASSWNGRLHSPQPSNFSYC